MPMRRRIELPEALRFNAHVADQPFDLMVKTDTQIMVNALIVAKGFK